MIELILTIALVGLIVWAVTTFVPMPPAIKSVIIAVAVIFVILWIIRLVGLDMPIPRAR